MAVEPQPRKIQIAALIQVHFHPVHDLLQLRPRDPERPDQGSERARHRMLRIAREEPRDLAAPPRQGRARDRRIARLVHRVVDLPAEGVERGDRAPALERQEKERVIKPPAAVRGLVAAIFLCGPPLPTPPPPLTPPSSPSPTHP